MQTITVFLVITALVSLLAFGLARFYAGVSSSADDSHWVSRTGKVAFVLAAFSSLATVGTLLALSFNFYEAASVPLTLAKVTLLALLLMATMLFVLPVTRQAALSSAVGKVLGVLFSAFTYLLMVFIKVVHGVLKLSAKSSKGGREVWDTRGPWSHHGYEGYTERAERIRGKPFGDHL